MTHYDVKDFNNRLKLILLAFGVRLSDSSSSYNRGALDSLLSQHAKGNNMCKLTFSTSPVLLGLLDTYVFGSHRAIVLYATESTDIIVRQLVIFFETLKHYRPLPFDIDTLVIMAELTLLGNTHS